MSDVDSRLEALKAKNAESAEVIKRLKEQLAIAQHNAKQGVSTTPMPGKSLDPQLSTTFDGILGGKRSRKRKRNTKRRKSRRRR